MTENPKPLALKFAYGKDLMRDLRKEAKIYDERLEPVQGSAVPNFFGLYKTKIPVKDRFVRIVGCLLLEYCGESVGLFEYLEVPTRALLLKKLRDIHLCGIMHGDFAERNVVMQGDDIRIIDFHHASRHKCGVKMEVAESRRIPKTSDFGCVDLWIHCYDMYIWRSTYLLLC
ncbi:hypothetical protein NEOLEDRAFT_1079084 [Neolentinus lepideus HHB14362 ss-1]|uniref:Non-specific serine/threonine protein kinase n=1 Tax=Neolentinus lepideus HHB14362 ss-1 TaxID=1314782 RepID=A0A165MXG4_9AGAM|nr:hypothetical protein NEOLEDRAFT_1079084 [Neolentinus lepideus HHB14362 ss-1]